MTLRSWLSGIRSLVIGKTRASRRKQQPAWAASAVEMLEIRQVPTMAVLQAGVLTITGSDQADEIAVTKSGKNWQVSGVNTTFAVSKVKSVVVNAGDGDDVVDLTSLTVKARVFGGTGNDSLTGGSGADTLVGESGNDTVSGNAGNDSLDGGADVDLVVQTGNAKFALTDSRLTGLGTDKLSAIETASLKAGVGNNRLDASKFSGSVSLFGGAGKDTLLGGSNDDLLFGELGNDVIDGGAGVDMVDGVDNDIIRNSEQLHGQVIESDDDEEHNDGYSPRFVVQGNKWGSTTVTYSFMATGVRDSSNFDGGWTNTAISDFMPVGAIDEIRRAFAAWSEVANIRFIEIPDVGEAFGGVSGANIRIGGHAMDGGSGTLAHGYFPPPNGNGAAGDIHFDISENWRVRSLDGDPRSVDIFSVAAHEIGHAIGLKHEPKVLALMNPNYNESINGLQPDDIAGARSLYGVRDNTIRYEGVSPATAMTTYRGDVLTAFSNVSGNSGLYRVHRSTTGSELGSGTIVYEGISPVTAMLSYNGGVLTAFSNVGGNPNLYRVHWSPDGLNMVHRDSWGLVI